MQLSVTQKKVRVINMKLTKKAYELMNELTRELMHNNMKTSCDATKGNKLIVNADNYDTFVEYVSLIDTMSSSFFGMSRGNYGSKEDSKDNKEYSFEYKFSLTDKCFDEYAQ